ncbi:MAG TPA: hypothetical protein DDX11_02510 [Candidatus Peribacter riflensis]|uniref:Quinoprotein glucose dehydrogenase n=1 Tax=Candidatus Peribacter riflensis TaxID=1735162 RepID=A0A0S1SIV4_9BACT|nr:MAG: quinoprotein glucose dehydrogenase [Candidatus Peribacter riflensis]OGJ79049.1 MAG: hypothetical protein A2398_00010 [Candidatus Peribacteria bacterium RIFOXYB1_FULL_57_12]OGJ83126.1 MAG: hypothetical protein A2412_04985 [Candidatus Peribacteria bacterium RIFOXYC1_FULL_58_8]ALM11276.1 MAG: quinoprotein glucose dehydrogenase [Candidatus Peribacter riflensis]ALM12378.1 MAG: quinoprotein glucose dehydrogenase [Candidatus Peribacter riflensis]
MFPFRFSGYAIAAACVLLVGCAGTSTDGTNANSSSSAQGGVFCTMEAKICPDGSAVGRVPPTCAFAPCPGEN